MLDRDTTKKAILARFPRANLYPAGLQVPGVFIWGFQIGWVTIGLRFHEEAKYDFIVVIEPSFETLIKPVVWKRAGESWEQALVDLDLLRAELLGMSQGIHSICKKVG